MVGVAVRVARLHILAADRCGDVAREVLITEAIKTQVFNPALKQKEMDRMQEIAGIMQAQGALKTRDGKPFDVKQIVDLSWQEERKL